jgi:hypothetical protein
LKKHQHYDKIMLMNNGEKASVAPEPDHEVDPLVHAVAEGVIHDMPKDDAALSVNGIRRVLEDTANRAEEAGVNKLAVLDEVGATAPAIAFVAQGLHRLRILRGVKDASSEAGQIVRLRRQRKIEETTVHRARLLR